MLACLHEQVLWNFWTVSMMAEKCVKLLPIPRAPAPSKHTGLKLDPDGELAGAFQENSDSNLQSDRVANCYTGLPQKGQL